MLMSCTYGDWSYPLAAAVLAARRCTARGASARTFVLVAEYQSAFFKVIGRHFDGHPVARQRLDPVLLHLARSVGNDLVAGVELNAVARVGKDFGDQSFELDQLFFSHGFLQNDRRLAWPVGAIRTGVRTALPVQERHALHALGLGDRLRSRAGPALRRTRVLPLDLVPGGVLSAIATIGTGAAARTF